MAAPGELPRPVVYWDTGCPYAQRIQALLVHLGVPFDSEEAPHGHRPPGLFAWSPSGRIPFFVQGDLGLGESRVILEYLAEAYGFGAAWSADLRERALERQAAALFDVVLVPSVFRDDAKVAEARLAECLDVFEAIADRPVAPSLLAFLVAPMWLRLTWWRPERPVTQALHERARLRAWLDGIGQLPAVVATSPSDAVRAWR